MNGTPPARPGTYTHTYKYPEVPGKKDVVDVVTDTVAWTPTDNEWDVLLSPDAPDSVSDSDPALRADSSATSPEPATLTTSAPKLAISKAPEFSDIPQDALITIAGQLSAPGSFARSDTVTHQAVQEMHCSRLKPEYRVGNFTLSYASPKKRQDQFVPLDSKGLAYLSSLGITHQNLINQIKKGMPEGMSINEAEQIVWVNRQKIKSAIQSGGHIAHALTFPQIRYFVECGLISLERLEDVGSRDGDSIRLAILGEPALGQYVDEGTLSIQDLIEMSLDAWAALKTPVIRQYLKDNKLLMKDILAIHGRTKPAPYEIPLVRGYFNAGILSKKDLLDMPTAAASAFDWPQVKQYLESGDSSLKQDRIRKILDIAMGTEWRFRNSFVQRCLSTGQMSMEQFLSSTPKAHAVFDYVKYLDFPKDADLDIEKILGYDGSIKNEELYKLNVKDFIKSKASSS